MLVASIGKTYVKVCRPEQETVIENGKPEMARWAKLAGNSIEGTTVAIPMISDGYCVQVGNNTPPQGVLGKLFDFLSAVAPFVAMAFGIPAL
jgi:hypothetical protein